MYTQEALVQTTHTYVFGPTHVLKNPGDELRTIVSPLLSVEVPLNIRKD